MAGLQSQVSSAQDVLLSDAVSRRRFGFSEYNSDTYAPIAFNPLVTVAGIARDEDIRTLAAIVTILQLMDWTLAAHRGVIGSPRGHESFKRRFSKFHNHREGPYLCLLLVESAC